MINVSESVATIINFVIFLGILTYFLFKPIQNILNTRENDIKSRIKTTKENEKKAENLLVENSKIINESKEKGKALVEQYKIKAERISEEIIRDAKKEAALAEERSRNEINLEKEKARDELKKQIIDLSVLMCSKALEETIDKEKHKQLIKDFISKVGI